MARKEASAEEKSVVNDHLSHLHIKFSVNVKDRQELTFLNYYWAF